VSFFHSWIFWGQEVALRPLIVRAAKKLNASNTHQATLLAESIRDAFSRTPEKEELEYIDRIEHLRLQLNHSNEQLEITDYGANAKHSRGSVVCREVGEVAVSSSKSKRFALLLFYLIRRFTPERLLELGTCLGISTLYQSAALALNGKGTIVTVEGARSLASLAQKNFTALGCKNITGVIGKFENVLGDIIKQHQPFDFIFVDGHHEKLATINYFEQLLPGVSADAIMVFDDIHWSRGMKEAWKYITGHQRVKHSVNLYQLGIIIVR